MRSLDTIAALCAELQRLGVHADVDRLDRGRVRVRGPILVAEGDGERLRAALSEIDEREREAESEAWRAMWLAPTAAPRPARWEAGARLLN